MIPFPTQLSGAHFLASRNHALLADEPRCGKTGTAIMAADYIMATSILVITTASGRGVWLKGFSDWSVFDRDVQAIMNTKKPVTADTVIVGWPSLVNPRVMAQLLARKWDLVISDEDHFAKNFTAKRTQSLYGKLVDGGATLDHATALYSKAARVWPLTGTPIPHSPDDMYPRLRALAPERLLSNAAKGWPCVMEHDDFLHRYCVVRMKKLSQFNRIKVVIGGQNLPELRERIKGFILLRTQADVGIRPPSYDTLPLIVSETQRRAADANLDQKAILEAVKDGKTKELDMHLGPLRRITGEIKAAAVIAAVKEEFDCGLDRIVLAYWHRDVGKILMEGLSQFGVVGIDGATSADMRQKNVEAFSDPKGPRVFLAQIEAAGEAIDLSAAAVLWFVEASFSPRSMKQMSLRITNHEQRRNAVVKVCVLQGSIDEALQASLMRLWTAIREVLTK
ncbi:SNF2-related protein [Hoeflea sp. G2-23]|uniref:SNF2-related protein n=1 Tax=Hoeflea algicola TaxID=2983763 RepID=A0ABT3Z980_9HYPH|nr:helicase-related protein [Hoeflea algicola]MCY0148346.1 SNF2-related protein [Hoeflea algicola]